ncbi:MAG: lipopolysaccharide biosynthesis protein [Bacillota bacterium]
MNIFIKKLVGFSIGPVAGALISFITIPLTTYFVSPSEYGKASMFFLFQMLITVLLYLGLDQSYTREYHNSDNKVNLLKNAMLIPLLLSIFLFICICTNLNIVSIFLFDSYEYKTAALLFGITLIFVIIERFILLSIRMEEKALEYSIVNVVIKLNILLFTLLFVFFIRRDFLAVVYSTTLGQIIADIYLIIRFKQFLNFKNFHFDKSLFIKLIKFGFPLIIAASLTSLLNSIDRIALRAWSNFTEIGIFTAALKISATLSVIQASFTSFWVPTAYRWHSQNKDIKHFEVVSNVLLLIMSILFCFILLLKDLVSLLLSPEYVESKYIIGLLCLQPIMYTVSETTTLGIVFSKKSYLNIWISVLAVIPNILLNIILIPKYGAIGAAIATGISYILFFFSRSYFSNKNWIGFSFKNHVFVTLIIFIGALINTQNYHYIILINIGLLILIMSVQVPTIKKILILCSKKDKENWDFS